MTDRPLLVCLLPFRNGSAHLDGWLASVDRFADFVLALDDVSISRYADQIRAAGRANVVISTTAIIIGLLILILLVG